MINTVIMVLDWFGILVFVTTGALAAARHQMDVFGFILLGTATGIGGGTIRDLLLGTTPVFWIVSPEYLIACVTMSVIVFFAVLIAHLHEDLLLKFDAVGLALFAVLGAERALSLQMGPVVSIAMGVVTSTFGGVVRDILRGKSPAILREEIYASAAFLGALVFVIASQTGFGRETALGLGFALALCIRLAAIQWHWALPRHHTALASSGADQTDCVCPRKEPGPRTAVCRSQR